MVFHDERLDRLVAASGRISERSPAALARLTYRHQSTGILRFEQLLELVGERVPLLVEVKRNKHPPPRAFLERIAAQAALYRGPLGLMSFDRDLGTLLSRLAPGVARGWVVGRHQLAARWWAAPPTARKDAAVARLLSSAPGEIAFLAVDVKLIKSARGFLAARAI